MQADSDRKVTRVLAVFCCALAVLLIGQTWLDSGRVAPPDFLTALPERQPDAQGRLLIPINSAGVEALDELPGIGPALAQAIVDEREANGPFESIDALTRVKGIGPAKLEQIRNLVCLEE